MILSSSSQRIQKSVYLIILTAVTFFAFNPASLADNDSGRQRPAVLFFLQGKSAGLYDYSFFRWLNEHGIDVNVIPVHKQFETPIDWDQLQQYNCVVFETLPGSQEQAIQNDRIIGGMSKVKMKELIERFLNEGGGIFFAPSIQKYGSTIPFMRLINDYLRPWEAAVPLDRLHDPSTTKKHPHSEVPFLYTRNITDTPVSEDVKAVWFPIGPVNSAWYQLGGSPVKISPAWQAVVRGGPTSYTEPHTSTRGKRVGYDLSDMPHRNEPHTPPVLFAIRDFKNKPGRLALTAFWNIFLTGGGSSWAHNHVMIDRGLEGKPTDFGRLYANTLHWLSAPSLTLGTLGGYKQDPAVLKHPHFRKSPTEQYPRTIGSEEPEPYNRVFRGLIGARTELSTGTGDVAAYAEAARKAGLDFIVFLEEFNEFTKEDARMLEALCQKHSDSQLVLTPGYTIKTNIGDNVFFFGKDLLLPHGDQLDDQSRLRIQNFKPNGELAHMDGKAKDLFWAYQHKIPAHGTRNSGYYYFSDEGGQPVSDIGLYGMLALRTYIDGQLVEDITPEYLQYTRDGNPPRLCSINLVKSPAELQHAVETHQTLTHVAAPSLEQVQTHMIYGHQYGRQNVYPSSAPRIRHWAGTTRYQTFAGEPFVPSRARVRPLLWIDAEDGLTEVSLYEGTKRIRRFLLNGRKQFKHRFEWAFDRQKVITVIATDTNGNQAVSAGREIWYEANANIWMADRQNSGDLLWHGPLTMPGPKPPLFSEGPLWDGGGGRSFMSILVRPQPGVVTQEGFSEGATRPMAGDMWNSCYDQSVANYTAVGRRCYAPGVVANAYHTFGPMHESRLIDFTIHRTQYMHRITGPRTDSWEFYADRRGGNLALMEGSFTFKRDAQIKRVQLAYLVPRRIDTTSSNKAVYLYRRSSEAAPFAGTLDSFHDGSAGSIPPGLSKKPKQLYTIEPGGYIGLVGTDLANNAVILNTGEGLLRWVPGPQQKLELVLEDPHVKEGDRVDYRYLTIYDELGTAPKNLARIELLRQYLGLATGTSPPVEVLRGSLKTHSGLIDLTPDHHLVEFRVPEPGFNLNVPVGLRFHGFNPNWTVGLLQIKGYSTGYYSNGNAVYRNLGLDDMGVGHLVTYPDHAGTHGIVGHPVVCGDARVNIQVTRLHKHPRYYVAINNPTDETVTTDFRCIMPNIGLVMEDQEITLKPGEFNVILDQRQTKPAEAQDWK